MAIDDLHSLSEELPQVFDGKPLPPDWDDDWIYIPVDPTGNEFPSEYGLFEDSVAPPVTLENWGGSASGPSWIPPVPGDFPGGPVRDWNGNYLPPPDALAFYLPFHYFYPVWWGIYLTVEGVHALADHVYENNGGKLTKGEARLASQLFLYAHEAYHHKVESFATRLEISHRLAFYKDGFEDYYQEACHCLEELGDFPSPDEEALASAYAYQNVANRFDKERRTAILEALRLYIEKCPPGYNRALSYVNDFSSHQCEFAARMHDWALNSSTTNTSVWLLFSYAFMGMGRITSRVNYIIRRNSPTAQRQHWHLRYLRYGELAKKLKVLGGCREARSGKGSHIIWHCADGRSFPVPRHPRDLKRDTLKKILNQAGINMPLSHFLAANIQHDSD